MIDTIVIILVVVMPIAIRIKIWRDGKKPAADLESGKNSAAHSPGGHGTAMEETSDYVDLGQLDSMRKVDNRFI